MDIVDLRLKTHDLDALHDFYADELGFAILDEVEDEYITLDAGGTRLTFEADKRHTYSYHFAFNIPHNQLADAKAWLVQHTTLFAYKGRDIIERPDWQAESLYYRDPAGNICEVMARYAIQNSSSIPFSGQSVTRVSEIGLVVNNVNRVADDMKNTLGLAIWDKRGEDFIVVGDEWSAFILVNKHHLWFPTKDVRAMPHPLDVTIRSDKAISYAIPGTDYVIKTVVT